MVRHAALLRRWNRRAGLVSDADVAPPALARHYLESVAALDFLGAARAIVDLGSGGGFPGLVWAAFWPDLPVTLVESARRKAAFLRQAAFEMGLTAVGVHAERIASAGELSGLGADLVTTRATGLGPLLVEALGRGAVRRAILYDGSRETPLGAAHLVASVPLGTGAMAGSLRVLDAGRRKSTDRMV